MSYLNLYRFNWMITCVGLCFGCSALLQVSTGFDIMPYWFAILAFWLPTEVERRHVMGTVPEVCLFWVKMYPHRYVLHFKPEFLWLLSRYCGFIVYSVVHKLIAMAVLVSIMMIVWDIAFYGEKAQYEDLQND